MSVVSGNHFSSESIAPPPGDHPSPFVPQQVAEANWRRSFWALIVTQFQGAFSANTFQYFLLYLVLGMGLAREQQDRLVSVIPLFFAAPFVLFSMTGGFLADRFSKRRVTIATKFMEITAMTLAVLAFLSHSMAFELTVLFLVATQAALFGPSKYGLLPEILPQKWLSWGNGILELGTFLSIISGMVCAALLSERMRGHESYVGLLLVALAAVGLVSSLAIGRVPAAAPQKKFRANMFGDLWQQVRIMRSDSTLLLAVIGNTYFWFLGTLFLQTVVVFGAEVFHVPPSQNVMLQAGVALGIGVGSAVAGYLSGNKIEYGLIPLGCIGMTVMAAIMGGMAHSFASSVAILAGLGFFAGFVAVPVNALIQHRPSPDVKGGVIAAANLLSFVGVAAASGTYFLLSSVGHLYARGVFLAGAVITLAGTIYGLVILPDWFLRLVLWFLTHTIYRIKLLGRDNIPEKGGALLVCNHMSFVDVLLLIATTDRPIRFLMFQDIYDMPALKPFARMMGAIPISSELRPRDMIRSLRTASDAIRNGEVVCIFAEGQISRTGQMLPFRRGMERIMQDVDAPIVPVALHGVWGSIFSFENRRFLWKFPRRVPYPVTVNFGKWLPPTATSAEVRRSVQELLAEASIADRKSTLTLDRAFVRTTRRYPLRFALADARVPKILLGGVLVKTIFVARRLRHVWKGQEMVGLLLPPSVGGALVNYAATLLGLVPINLNYTASNEVIASSARQCNLQTVITSKAFLERFPNMEVPGQALLLEDLLANPRTLEKLAALFFAWMLPFGLLKKALGARMRHDDDLATVIFSSGSTGEPKGVMLTHYNVLSNIRQVTQVFILGRKDKLLGILPFFHSFGFTVTMWMPPIHGIGSVFHPNPLDAKVIGELVSQYSITLAVATPTFLQAYMRRCSPESFGSLLYMIVGAEKLTERLSIAFEEIFGLRPLEGYGCTECSPVVAVNAPGYRAPGFHQVSARRGTIGHPLPGVAVRIVDPETMQPLPSNQAGLLLVKGPNVMKGYLGRPEKTAEVIQNGWYVTGDIATMEDDGFLIITDRLSRFSKIGGEMVPHIKIEERLQEFSDRPEQVFAVAAVPDEKKGERIIVLHTLQESALTLVLEKFQQCDLPALWKPKSNQFFHVEALPYLGTGKIDLRAVKDKAVAAAASSE
ncbi:MAG: MFS transporter [Acidobacteriia bacterium]|nr:MFS transporter [Terriglobia bacterium]